jgi:hypothetical protein
VAVEVASMAKRDWCGRAIADGPIVYIDSTGVDLGDIGHAAVMKAIANGGTFDEDFADLFTLSRPAGVWIVSAA